MGRKKKSARKQSDKNRQSVKAGFRKRRSKQLPRLAILVFATVSLLAVSVVMLVRSDGSPLSWFLESAGSPRRLSFPQPDLRTSASKPTFEEFVGSEVCGECHPQEYEIWQKSTHGRAGGSPKEVSVLGKFNGVELQFKDARVRPRIDKNGSYTFEVAQRGFANKEFEVDAVVGGGHMEGGGTQTYFSEFPDGTLRFLPFDFIRKENVWFGETKGAKGWIPISEELSITDLGEWPPSRILGTHSAFENCQQCHGSQIQVEYDTERKRYLTRYKSLTINCESCHGPGRRHVEIARSGKIDTVRDIGMTALQTLNKDESLNVCFQCHALKDVLDSDYLPGMDLEKFYSLKFPILGETPYLPDGRIRAFGYQQNHLYSDCYINGSMTCVDCHDPHSQNYRDITGTELVGKFDNRQCTGCHASKGQAPEKHSHHKPDSAGNLCTSCHMPFLQHKSTGTRLRFARSDHTIPIPRPQFDASLGVENACKKCHSDKTIVWLQNKTEQWYGKVKPHKTIIENQVEQTHFAGRVEAARLLLMPEVEHPIAQVSGLSIFIQKFLSPDMPPLEADVLDRLKALAESDDLDVQALALAALHLAQDNDLAAHNDLVEHLQSLEDDEMAVRRRWALALAFLARQYRDQGYFDKSIRTYRKSLEILPKDSATLTNLAVTLAQKGEHLKAIKTFEQALQINPTEVMAWVSMGIAYGRLGDVNSEADAYRQALSVNPWTALAHFNLGNVYYKSEEYEQAISSYQRAVEIEPSLALGHFYLGRTYVKTGRLREAAAALRRGLQFSPDDQPARKMLADLENYLRNR